MFSSDPALASTGGSNSPLLPELPSTPPPNKDAHQLQEAPPMWTMWRATAGCREGRAQALWDSQGGARGKEAQDAGGEGLVGSQGSQLQTAPLLAELQVPFPSWVSPD